ncbi:MAG: site-2 protease family protein [Mycobacteriaceae bacterium]
MPLGRLAGIPVNLAPSWLLGAALLTVVYAPFVRRLVPGTSTVASVVVALTLALLLGLSVLLHELGHCLAAVRTGAGVRQVELSLLGGVTELARQPRDARTEGTIAAAGPLVSVVLAVAALVGWRWLDVGDPLTLPSLLLLQVGLANAAVAVTNLLPGLPLDGGRVLSALAWGLTGRPSAGIRAARVGSVVVAAGVAVWGVHALTERGTGAWVQVLVAAFLVVVLLDGARGEAEDIEAVTVLGARTPLAVAVAHRGTVLVADDEGSVRAELDRGRAGRVLAVAPGAVLGEAVALLRPEQLVNQGSDLSRARDGAGVGVTLVILDVGRRAVGVLR